MDSKGQVIWLTGLSGAGKTTVARALRGELTALGHRVETLDGDEVRENLSRGLTFSKEDRETNVRRIGFVARLLARNGVIVLASAISPYRQSRDDVRRSVESEGARATCPTTILPLGLAPPRGKYRKMLRVVSPLFSSRESDDITRSRSQAISGSRAKNQRARLWSCHLRIVLFGRLATSDSSRVRLDESR